MTAAPATAPTRVAACSPRVELSDCLSVIIPVYNEAGSLEAVLSRVRQSPVRKEIIVVDDGSTDGGRELLRGLPADPALRILFHDGNQGKGAAIRTGLQHIRGEFVVIQDADLEYDPEDYARLLEPLRQGRTNVVYGVRPDRPDRGWLFFWGAKFLTFLANLLYGCGIHDEATGHKVFRRSVLARMTLKCRRFEFCPEVTAKMCRLGETIWEIPISYSPRCRNEGKKLRWTDGWSAIWTLVRYRFEPGAHFEVRPNPVAPAEAAFDGSNLLER